MPKPPWSQQRGIDSVVERWLAPESNVKPCLTASYLLPAQAGELQDLPRERLAAELLEALRKRQVARLYRHQVAALEAALGGRHVVIATPTASGKSLCFHLPVLQTLAQDPTATAIYLYPTKALSRDQEAALRALIDDAGLRIPATVYDGDTPGDARRSARQHAAVVMTNPDMLHSGILPQHASWSRLLQSLRYVVVDELHTYRGVFGSHVAHVLGRLRRAARFHGADPTFICATATIGNPGEHAARLLDAPPSEIALIDKSSAPRGARRVLVYNPPIVNAELGIRQSYLKSAVRLAADLIAARVRTIIFGHSRNAVEIMLKYLRDWFHDQPAVYDAIFAYRGGYLPKTRRRIERDLREGRILCVVATSALELGIDIGQLDAVVCAGYPGSLAETWQRFGRAGRRGDLSLAVLIASSAPLDQYLAHHPDMLLDGQMEHARIDPHNTEILIQHLKCAAFELPFWREEAFGGLPPPETEAALEFLEQHGVVHGTPKRFHWAADAFPANHVSLRRVGWDNFVIIDQETGKALAELDWHSAPSMLHEQAIYQHDGLQYQVEELDYDNHKAYVQEVEPDYFTTALRSRDVRVLAVSDQQPGLPSARLGWGEVCVTEKVVGYKKIKFHTHENAGYGDVRLPDIEMHTESFWLTVDAAVGRRLGRAVVIEGLRGLARALELTATLALMCDPHDLGQAIGDGAPEDPDHGGVFSATAYLFDNVPGGVGLAERIYERAGELLQQARELIAGCPCALGCPSCVGATATGSGPAESPGEANRKAASLRLCAELGLSGRPAARPRPAVAPAAPA